MSDSAWLAIIVAVVALLISVLVAWQVAPRIRAARRNIWQRFARRHGFALRVVNDEDQLIEGTTHGRRLTIRRTDGGSDGDIVGLANVRIELVPRDPPSPGLTVVNAGEPVGRVAHMIDDHVANPGAVHQTDPAFHMLVHETDDSSGDAARFLTEERRHALQQLADEAGTATVGIESGKLFWEDRVFTGEIDQLERSLALLEQTADRLDAASPATSPAG